MQDSLKLKDTREQQLLAQIDAMQSLITHTQSQGNVQNQGGSYTHTTDQYFDMNSTDSPSSHAFGLHDINEFGGEEFDGDQEVEMGTSGRGRSRGKKRDAQEIEEVMAGLD